MLNEIILIGGGGHSKACIDVIESTQQYKIVGIIDSYKQPGTDVLGYTIIGGDQHIQSQPCQLFVISVGQIKSVAARIKLYEKVLQANKSCPKIISPHAYVSQHASIGDGTIVMHGVCVNAAARIGINCIVNTKANIEHDAIVGNHCHISTGATINGDCKVGNNCFIGSSSVVSSQVSITDNVIIGAGSVVVKNIDMPGTYVGNPVRRIA
ncbi:NeuD/PglB/VioB family sugar acetyltransferase [Candidatus Uabimicrobium amorphum]|uniref:Acetyltransferase n=1 Tax=Uabimicrobium amorphum TaxID=2596890 RepID=A0A5S9IN20_UABAM|nr:NeuD/PglB/VioB family sugar acetyltransferase [Candidatus Uabimicrobium amorphum]BBM84918.1 acetyltransferase [Candidatus Uabimicrobium amorphum]